MSSHEFPQRKSLLALLTVTGSLVTALPVLTAPAFAQTVPQGAPNARSTKAIVPCITNPKNKNTIQPCFANSKNKGMTATSTSASQTPKNGNWDMNNLKQAPSDPSKAKTR